MNISGMKKRQSLRFRLVAPFMAGTACLMIFLVTYTYLSMHRAVEQAVLSVCHAKTDNAVDAISILIRSLRAKGQDLIVDEAILKVLREHERRYGEGAGLELEQSILFAEGTSRRLRAMTEGYRYFRDILLLDRNAVCIASSNEGYLGVNFFDKDYVKQALDGYYYIGNFSIGRVTKTFSTYFSAPVDVGQGLEGVLVIISDFPGLVSDDIPAEHLSRIISTKMLTPQGVYMAHDDISIMGNKKFDFKKTYDDLATIGERGGAVSYTEDGESYVGYAHVEPHTHWLVITSGLTRDVFASAYNMGMTVFGVSLIFFCVVSFATVRYTSSILRVLFSLIHFAKDVSDGNLDKELAPSRRVDELGVLHNSLQKLVTHLQTMLRERSRTNKMKDEFLANMSHEIRTPLNAVIGLTHLVGKKDASPEKRKQYLDRIRISAESLLGIINDILDISKVEAGKMNIEARVFDLPKMLKETLTIHSQSFGSKGINLSLNFAEGMHTHYIGDALRIRQIVNNLLANAVKFTRQGEVKVACWEEALPHEEGVARIYFSVSDSGVGISPEAASMLFQPFVQADASVTRRFGGTGLGLAICKRLVELMSGEIWLESIVDKGSSFTFYVVLPVAEEKQGEAFQQSVQDQGNDGQLPHPSVQGKRILLAEDNSINQMIFKELLLSFEPKLDVVSNGKEAVDAVKESAYDLILMDIQMPEMGGLEATRLIRTLDNGKECGIIALTANARVEDKKVAFAAGMNDYLVKPIDPVLFEATIKKWLAKGE